METSVPEEVARLYEENDEIEKIYGLLRSGRQMREILGAGSREVPPVSTRPSVEPEAQVSQSIGPGLISDGVTDADQPAATDLSDARIPRAPRLSRRSVAVLSVMALIVVIVAVGFFGRWDRAARALTPLAGPQVAVAPANSPPVDPVPAVAPDSPAAVPEPPLIATVAAVSLQPKPVTVGDAPDPAAQPEATRPEGIDVAPLLGRGDALLAAVETASARLFYKPSAEVPAALQLGVAHDPAFLARVGLTGALVRRPTGLGAIEANILPKNTENK